MINSVTIVGNMGQDLKIRYTQDGVPVANFTVAVNEVYTGKDGAQIRKVHWFKVTSFERLTEIVAEYCTKGARIGIRGQLRYSQWQDSEGYNRSLVDIRAREIELLSHNNGDAAFGDDMPAADRNDEVPF